MVLLVNKNAHSAMPMYPTPTVNIEAHLLTLTSSLAGITNYPIGVGINGAGEVTIADNHNNFNLSVFSQDGVLISALESKVK